MTGAATIAEREAFVVVDLGFGDAGKGATVDFLVRDRGAGLVVRFHGGGQAGHRVVTPDGRAHVFSQVGAGTFVPGVRTHLGEDFVLHPLALRAELAHLEAVSVPDALARLTVDARARVITPFHQSMGRLVELARGAHRHGSVGIGFGDAVADALAGTDDVIRARELVSRVGLERKLTRVQERKRALARALGGELSGIEAAEVELGLLEDLSAPARVAEAWARFADDGLVVVDPPDVDALFASTRCVVLEGAQGVLLDERWGFHPHTTWSDCTFAGAEHMLAAHGFAGPIRKLGVMRAYATRHGAGPFPTEDAAYGERLVDAENDGASFQGAFRQGPLDLVLLRYALAAAGSVEGLVVNCIDRLDALDAVELVCRYRLDEASLLVERDGEGNVVRLCGGAPEDLAHREKLTRLLSRVHPLRAPIRSADLLPHIEAELEAPVILAGRGDTAAHRAWLRAPRSAE